MTHAKLIHPPRFADAQRSLRHVFVRDLELMAMIGVYGHEHEEKQRIRINLDLAVQEFSDIKDNIDNVVSYEDIVCSTRRLVDSGHVNLVETLAEKIADLCLADHRVRTARVTVEKLDVFPDAASVGVEIERFSQLL